MGVQLIICKTPVVHAEAINGGDMRRIEAMLANQATALQSLFAGLAERGMTCDHAAGFEANFRMALRAQSQCRATLETLAAIKNPPIVGPTTRAILLAVPFSPTALRRLLSSTISERKAWRVGSSC